MNDKTVQLLRELIDEVLDEMTGSGAAGPVTGKNWVGGEHNNDESTLRSIPGGKLAPRRGKETDNTTVTTKSESTPLIRRALEESRYYNFKKYPKQDHAKVCIGVNEAKKMLREVEFLVGICKRLKKEQKVDDSKFWKRTWDDIKEINRATKSIARQIQGL